MSDYTAEFIGTLLLVLLGDGVVANVVLGKTKGHNSGWIVITAGWGLAVAISVYCVGSISGGHLNPAITLGLATINGFPWEKVPFYMLAQFGGAFAGAFLVWLMNWDHWRETENPADKLAVFCTAPAIRNPYINFICEFIGTGVLMFGVLCLGSYLHQLTPGGVLVPGFQPGSVDLSLALRQTWNPFLVGLLVFAIGLSLGGQTGYAINPARDLAPRLIHQLLPITGKGSSDWLYAPIPVLAPLLGGMAGATIFRVLGMR